MVVSDLRDSKDYDERELGAGDHVVVIDCMTFVPEHIPVLKALEDLQLSTLPFNDGIMLFLKIQFATLLSKTFTERTNTSISKKLY